MTDLTEATQARIDELVGKRVAWLEQERRSGGNFEHLTIRIEECQYVAKTILKQAAQIVAEGMQEHRKAIENTSRWPEFSEGQLLTLADKITQAEVATAEQYQRGKITGDEATKYLEFNAVNFLHRLLLMVRTQQAQLSASQRVVEAAKEWEKGWVCECDAEVFPEAAELIEAVRALEAGEKHGENDEAI